MFHLFIWKWQPMLLDTFSKRELAEEALEEIKKINPEQQIWIKAIGCEDSVKMTIAKYKQIKA